MTISDSELHALAEAFESNWNSAQPEPISIWLQRVATEHRLLLGQLLLPIEIEHRLRRGESVQPLQDYADLGSSLAVTAKSIYLEILQEQAAATPRDPKLNVAKPLLSPPRAEENSAPQNHAASTHSGQVVGNYQLLELIGAGGMGQVWRAQQLGSVQRLVAVKLLRRELASSETRSRFELECRALAAMNHPMIARIIEAGADPTGQSWLAMELVQGVPLVEYCDTHQLKLQQRLELFRDVLNGVQHAHQKGILHRDLKPTNILVEQRDGRAVPKIIDFGLAKLVEPDPNGDSPALQTAFGQVVGTLRYMSPEQASLKPERVDTRSDIYALGIILLELMTSCTLIKPAAEQKYQLLDLLEQIREQDAIAPSQMFAALASADQSQIATARGTDASKLERQLRGELDWIVLKALDREPERRYPSVTQLIADVTCYLQDEPISARPPSAIYRLRKFARRNRWAIVFGCSVFSALAVGLIAAVYSAWQANLARDLAEDRMVELQAANLLESEARRAADAAQHLAENRLQQVSQGSELLGDIFANLNITTIRASNEPVEAVLAQRLIAAAQRLDSNLIDDKSILADLRDRLGASLTSLGYAAEGLELCRQAWEARQQSLGADHPLTLTSQHHVGESLLKAGKATDAQSVLEETWMRQQRVLGPQAASTINTQSDLGLALHASGKFEPALERFREVLRLREQDSTTSRADLAEAMSNVAYCLRSLGQYAEAFNFFQTAHQIIESELGPRHPRTLIATNNLAYGYIDTNRRDLAVPLLEENTRLRAEILGPEHPSTLDARGGLANLYRDLGQVDRAIDIAEDVLERTRRKLGPRHPDTLYNMNTLARCYRAAGKLDKALPLYEETWQLRREELGEQHPSTLSSANNLAQAYVAAERFEEALPLLTTTLTTRQKQLGADHPSTLVSLHALATATRALKRFDEALPLLEDVVARRRQKLGEAHPETVNSLVQLAGNLLDLQRGAEAIPLWEKAIQLLESKPPVNLTELTQIRRQLAAALVALDRQPAAVSVLEQAYAAIASSDQIANDKSLRIQARELATELIQLQSDEGAAEQRQHWQAELERWKNQ